MPAQEPINGTELGVDKVGEVFVITASGTPVVSLSEAAMMSLIMQSVPRLTPEAMGELITGAWNTLGNKLGTQFQAMGQTLGDLFKDGGPFGEGGPFGGGA